MSDYYKEKALQATLGRINNIQRQKGFMVRNLWKVIAFGIFVSFWAPLGRGSMKGFAVKSPIDVGGYTYFEMVIGTAVGYTFFCILSHYIWKFQDKKDLKRLNNRKNRLEKELGLSITPH